MSIHVINNACQTDQDYLRLLKQDGTGNNTEHTNGGSSKSRITASSTIEGIAATVTIAIAVVIAVRGVGAAGCLSELDAVAGSRCRND